jgi:hypothetical protein
MDKRINRNKLLVIAFAGLVSAVSATSLIDTDFTSPYANGNIVGQEGWLQMPDTGAFAFEVDASAGVADTEPYAADFNTGSGTNGHYVYLDSSLGNAVDDEWSGVLDFSLSTTAYAGTNIALFSTAQDVYQIGLTDTVTNRLGSGDVTMQFRIREAGLDVTLSKAGRFRTLGQLSNADLGWDPANSTSPDFQTDDLSLIWTIRKTRVANTYSAVATISNKISGVVSVFDPDLYASPNLNYSVFSNVYNAASLNLAMGHNPDADDNGSNSLIHIAIDSLSVDQTSGNVPVLEAPVLSASSGNNLVDLSWIQPLEATSYEVKRSTTSGSGYTSLSAGITTNVYTDTTAVNDTLYYYIVTASAPDAADVDSNEVLGEPQAAQTGSIFDTHFKSSEGYADASDLAGQDKWKAATATGAQAFQVTDAAGSGFADSEPYTNSFNSTLGNDVYYNGLMSNNVGDEWTGSITFRLKTTATPGQDLERVIELFDASGTNSIGFVTNTYTVSGTDTGERFKIGLSSDPSSGLDNGDVNDIFLYLRSTAKGDVNFTFDAMANKTRIVASLSRADMGWDPNWLDVGNAATNGPDFETEPITFSWTIRKTVNTNIYSAVASASVGTNSFSSGTTEMYAGSTGAYAAEFIYFGMGVDKEATKGEDVNTGVEITCNPVTVAIDSISLDKADEQAPSLFAPGNLAAEVNTGTAILTWTSSLEASDYAVRRYSDYTGGSFIVLTNGVVDPLTYTDTNGLVNGTTYFYTVAANYGVYGEAETDRLPVRPLGVIQPLKWGFSSDVVSGNYNLQALVSTGINLTGGRTDGKFYDASDSAIDTALAPPISGIAQLGDGIWNQKKFQNYTAPEPDDFRFRTKSGTLTGNGYLSAHLFVDLSGSPVDISGGTYAYELQGFNAPSTVPGESIRATILSGGQWYASETPVFTGTARGAASITIPDLTTEKWTAFTPATTASTTLMTVTNASFAVVPGLTSIEGIGVLADHVRQVSIEGLLLKSGEKATDLQLWTDSYNIYNEDAAATNDYDNDGVVNVHEWGTMGDPTDANDNGHQGFSLGLDTTGTNLVYVYPRLENDPRPNYTVLGTEDLIYKPWAVATEVREVGAGLWNTNRPSMGLEAVTNLIPANTDTKFIGLEITE